MNRTYQRTVFATMTNRQPVTNDSQSTTSPEVAVVGAGISGLACASGLLRHGTVCRPHGPEGFYDLREAGSFARGQTVRRGADEARATGTSSASLGMDNFWALRIPALRPCGASLPGNQLSQGST